MTPKSRLPILVAGVAIIVPAFFSLRPDDKKQRDGGIASAPDKTRGVEIASLRVYP